jgi:hypothetical protein
VALFLVEGQYNRAAHRPNAVRAILATCAAATAAALFCIGCSSDEPALAQSVSGSGGARDAGSSGAAGGSGTGGSTAGGMSGSGTGGTKSAGGAAGGLSSVPDASPIPAEGGPGWIVPPNGDTRWDGPLASNCPTTAPVPGSTCATTAGTRCAYPSYPSGDRTRRCQCYESPSGGLRWWCEDHWNIGWDECPIELPGNGPCPNLGDVTCYYVDTQGGLQACNCIRQLSTCMPWGP